jgi:hypothetical protein
MYGIDEIVTDNISELNERLSEVFSKYGLKHSLEEIDFHYQFHSREEFIYIPDSNFESLLGDLRNKFPLEEDSDFNLPGKFGVYRGYSGGGIHSSLIESEYHELTEFLQKHGFEKAGEFLSEVLEEFRNTFWKIHQDIDSYIEEETGEEIPVWEKSSL